MLAVIFFFESCYIFKMEKAIEVILLKDRCGRVAGEGGGVEG